MTDSPFMSKTRKPTYKKLWFWLTIGFSYFILIGLAALPDTYEPVSSTDVTSITDSQSLQLNKESTKEDPETGIKSAESTTNDKSKNEIKDAEISQEINKTTDKKEIESPNTSSNTNKQSKQYEEYSKLPKYDYRYIEYYSDINGINLLHFSKETKINDFIKTIPDKLKSGDYYNLKLNTKWLGTSYYSITASEPQEYIYIGDLKDNKPSGIGCILKASENFEGLMFPTYIGEFKDGYLNGLGYERDINSFIYSSSSILDAMKGKDNSQSEFSEKDVESAYDKFIKAALDCNTHIIYKGEFRNGEYEGKGNLIEYSSDLGQLLESQGEISKDDMKSLNINTEISILTGNFKDGYPNDTCKFYDGSKLIYEGEMKKGKYNGKGRLYYIESGKLKYSGGFKNNEYDGQGTLYDESGKVIYDGKWDFGEYAN